jgi:hypothetical protein
MPLSRLWMTSAPTTAPGTEPTPPASDVPPITAPEIA